jgi:hypothetical protein
MLSEAKRTLLEKRLRGEFIGGLRTAETQPSAPDAPRVVSFAQERLWHLEQLDPAGGFYNIPLFVRIQGDLDERLLQRSLDTVVRRHAVLRSTFKAHDGRPVLMIRDLEGVLIRPLDGCGDLRRTALAEVSAPFDLEQGPLLRAAILRTGEHDRVFFLTAHTTVCDPWGLKIVAGDLAAIYNGRTLAPLRLEYSDFAAWQRKRLEGGLAEAQLSYWKQKLQGPIPALSLPFDGQRPAGPSMTASREYLDVPLPLARKLDDLSRREATTLFAILISAYYVLLQRWSGESDITVGSAIANPGRSELEGLTGFFLNLVPFRADLSANPTLREVLRRVRRTCLDAIANQDIPFARLVEACKLRLSGSATTFPQVMFDYQTEDLALPLTGMQTGILPVGNETMKFDLDLTVVGGANGLSAAMKYSTDLFKRETIAAMLEDYRSILDRLVSEPDAEISWLPSRAAQASAPPRALPGDYSPPRDELEAKLAELWEETLGTGPIGIGQNFFEAGGNSLLAVSLLDRICKTTGRRIPAAAFYRTPTIEQQAEILSEANQERRNG